MVVYVPRIKQFSHGDLAVDFQDMAHSSSTVRVLPHHPKRLRDCPRGVYNADRIDSLNGSATSMGRFNRFIELADAHCACPGFPQVRVTAYRCCLSVFLSIVYSLLICYVYRIHGWTVLAVVAIVLIDNVFRGSTSREYNVLVGCAPILLLVVMLFALANITDHHNRNTDHVRMLVKHSNTVRASSIVWRT